MSDLSDKAESLRILESWFTQRADYAVFRHIRPDDWYKYGPPHLTGGGANAWPIHGIYLTLHRQDSRITAKLLLTLRRDEREYTHCILTWSWPWLPPTWTIRQSPEHELYIQAVNELAFQGPFHPQDILQRVSSVHASDWILTRAEEDVPKPEHEHQWRTIELRPPSTPPTSDAPPPVPHELAEILREVRMTNSEVTELRRIIREDTRLAAALQEATARAESAEAQLNRVLADTARVQNKLRTVSARCLRLDHENANLRDAMQDAHAVIKRLREEAAGVDDKFLLRVLKVVHPDTCKHPDATALSAEINNMRDRAKR